MAGARFELPNEMEPRIETTTATAERPAPSSEDQLLADNLFSHDQSLVFAPALGAPTGLDGQVPLQPAYAGDL